MPTSRKNEQTVASDRALPVQSRALNVGRICQESKGHADVGWVLEFGVPDQIIPCGESRVLLRYGTVLVDLDAVTDGITYDEFKAIVKKGPPHAEG